MPSNHDNKFFSSQVKLDNSHNATDTSKKSVGKHSLHTQNRDVSDITYPQHDVDVSTSSQHDKKHFSFLNKSNSTHNDNSHNLSYSEIPNNSNSSFQNEKSYRKDLQQCEAQIHTAKALLQSFINQ